MIAPRNGLHKGTAILVIAVLRQAEERGGPCVTFGCAKRSLSMGKLSAQTGGSWQRSGEFRYMLVGTQGAQYREALLDYAMALQS